MNTAQPIRDTADLQKLKAYYKEVSPNRRNQALIILGLNTALRISDILKLKWKDVYDFHTCKYRSHLNIREKKTGKQTRIFLNRNIQAALAPYYMERLENTGSKAVMEEQYIFLGQKSKTAPISRIQAFRIIKKAAEESQIDQPVSSHSLRKTFGYQAWKQGYSPALLTNIYNHSSYKITIRYLGIEQDDRDEVFRDIIL